MRRIIVEIAVSMDGFIEGPDGELDWISADDKLFYIDRVLNAFDTLFYGRIAYEQTGILKPSGKTETEELRDFKSIIHTMRKFVFSKSAKHVRGNGMVISANSIEEAKRIKAEEGKNIWLCGGASIIRSFAEHDLIDEYVLAIHPVILGEGKRLFDNWNNLNLHLSEIKRLSSGVVLLYFHPYNRIYFQ